MTEKELMRKTKTELVQIILDGVAQTAGQEQPTTCEICQYWEARTGSPRGYCVALYRHTASDFYCAKAAKKCD